VPTLREFLPTPVPATFGLPLDGRRVQSISVNPVHPEPVLVANQFGGLWANDHRSDHWRHVDSLAVFAIDVAAKPRWRPRASLSAIKLHQVKGPKYWPSNEHNNTAAMINLGTCWLTNSTPHLEHVSRWYQQIANARHCQVLWVP
jgi:hypothetical protein